MMTRYSQTESNVIHDGVVTVDATLMELSNASSQLKGGDFNCAVIPTNGRFVMSHTAESELFQFHPTRVQRTSTNCHHERRRRPESAAPIEREFAV